MLATRSTRTQPQRRVQSHLTEGRNRGPRMISEASDPHKAAVLYESRKNACVKKWSPVMSKCREVPAQKMGLMAALFENQYNAWNPEGRSILFEDQTTTANIADFTRFALPLLRLTTRFHLARKRAAA